MVDSTAVFPAGYRILDASGNPLSGAKVKFFDGGTSTPKTVYSDKDLSASLGSIVYSRSDGYLVASQGSQTTVSVFTGAALYDLIITDADDVTVYPLKQNQKGALDTSTFLTSASTSTLSIPVGTSATDQSIGTSDRGKRRNANTASGNIAFTLAAAATLGDGWNFEMGKGSAANVALLQTTGGEMIHFNGQSHTSLALSQLGEALAIRCDGTQFYVGHYTPPLRNSVGVIVIADRITSAPGSATPGQRYLVTSSYSTFEAHDIIEADASGGFIEYTPDTDCGWIAYVQDEDANYQFRGSAWVGFAASDTVAGMQRNATQEEMETATSVLLNVTPGRQHFHPGHPKAWAYVTVAGGTPTLVTSYNVSGISDGGLGVLGISVGVDFSSANWAALVTVGSGAEGGGPRVSSYSAGGVSVDVYDQNGANHVDPASYAFAGFGDQA